MDDDVKVIRDETIAYDDGTVANVRVLSVPPPNSIPEASNTPFTTVKPVRRTQLFDSTTTTVPTNSILDRRRTK